MKGAKPYLQERKNDAYEENNISTVLGRLGK